MLSDADTDLPGIVHRLTSACCPWCRSPAGRCWRCSFHLEENDKSKTKTCGRNQKNNVKTNSVLPTVSITDRLRRLPVHGLLHRLLPSSVPKLTFCRGQTETSLCLTQEVLNMQNMRSSSVPSGLIWGSNFSDVTSLRSSGFRLQTLTPSAAPAAIAAPRAVVSGMDGFTGDDK